MPWRRRRSLASCRGLSCRGWAGAVEPARSPDSCDEVLRLGADPCGAADTGLVDRIAVGAHLQRRRQRPSRARGARPQGQSPCRRLPRASDAHSLRCLRARSRTKTSNTLFVSHLTRSDVSDAIATKRPSALIAALPLEPFPGVAAVRESFGRASPELAHGAAATPAGCR